MGFLKSDATPLTRHLLTFAACAAGATFIHFAYRHIRDRRSSTVCVTGASGYLASELVKQLLEKGYYVRGTVRSKTADRVKHLLALPYAKERLTLFEADLTRRGSFDEAVKGCCCVFHTASPFFLNSPSAARGDLKYEKNVLMKPAREGTLDVLCSATAARVDRVVITSSTATIYCRTGKPDDHCFSEADWSSEEALRENEDWYALSKICAERAAFEFTRAGLKKPKLVVLNPTLIIGPALQPKLNQSLETILRLIDGSKSEYSASEKTFVDVRDVALAHIRAHENDLDNERIMLIGDKASWSKVCDILSDVDPGARVPKKEAKSGANAIAMVPPKVQYTCAKSDNLLCIKYRKMEEMLKSSVESLKLHGHYEGLSESVVMVKHPEK
eukprot:g1387.t1